VAVAAGSDYYEHKNLGFDATSGQMVAFLDGDCQPAPTWLAALLAPLREGSQVVAGATSYAGVMAPLANRLDFLPYVVASYAPGVLAVVSRLGPAPALAVLGARALLAGGTAVRRGPLLRGLGLLVGVTALDALGALAAPLVYGWAGVPYERVAEVG
jgi:glycosyltransferase involved in cell wall biosynthesis